jgi:predicted ATPase/signal transduction histidine kinase
MRKIPGFARVESLHTSERYSLCRAQRADGTSVLVKLLQAERPEPSQIAWLRRECELLRGLDLPGLVKVHAIELQGGVCYVVLEDCGGCLLDDLHHIRGWPLTERLRVAIAATEALGQLHTHHLIHKGLSPANLMWNPETGVLKIISLGAATVLARETPAVRSPTDLEGSLPYMSPEQTGRVSCPLDQRTDFYSLGAVFYALFTGTPPFLSADPMELVHCHIARRPVEPGEREPGLPRPISDIVMRLLAKVPEARYQSTFGLKADLEECLAQLEATGAITPFPLARHDVPERLLIPQTLYGRSEELAALSSAFERATSGNMEGGATMAVVTGYSGIGKSMLVHELYKPITQRRGYFITGKFEQLQRATPYSAFVRAFRSLVQQLLGEGEAELALWRHKLLEAVGTNGRVVTDVIPEIELVIGLPPPIAELGPSESRNRFNHSFSKFISVFAQPAHPLVIFLDDLQWADSGSLTLLELLLTQDPPQGLFVISAYRDHEVGPEHPLRMTLDALRRAGVTLQRIALAPLGLADVTRFVADTLVRLPEEVEQLAQLVARKTEGNPLFITELLKSLHQDRLLDFDRAQGQWRWEIARIATRGIADNVADLMMDKLRLLPEDTQRTMQLAACVGGSFDIDTLAITLEAPAATAFRRLLPAIQEGFLVATSELIPVDADAVDPQFIVRDLKFAHDRVQQAAYDLVGREEQMAVHLRIGRQLLASMQVLTGDNPLFQTVDHLNRGRSLITDTAELGRLALLNLEAARLARKSQAYSAVESYLESGIQCLPEQKGEDAYALSFALHKGLAEAQFLTSNFERSEALIKHLLESARSVDDKVDLYTLLVRQYTIRARYSEALVLVKDGLSLLGMDLPTGLSAEQLHALVVAELAEVRTLLGSRPIISLVHDPEMKDSAAQACTSLLREALPPAFYTSQDLYALITVRAVSILLRFGASSRAADLFSHLGALISDVLGDHAAGYEFGRLAIAQSERFNQPGAKCRSAFELAAYIAPWSRPLRECATIHDAGLQAGFEGGEVIFVGYILTAKVYHKFYQGNPLDEVMADLQGIHGYLRKTPNRITLDSVLALTLVVDNLRGLTASPQEFRTGELEEQGFLAACAAHKSVTSFCYFWIFKAAALYFHGDLGGALAASEIADAHIQTIRGNFAIAYHYLYQSLILTALWPEVGQEEQARYREKLDGLRARWAQWAESCPEGLAHLSALVSAEVARIEGHPARAMDLYRQAIAEGHRGGYLQDVALSKELAARLCLEQGHQLEAAPLLREAHSAWRVRGAVRKAELLERQYAPLLGLSSPASEGSQGRVFGSLDLGSVLKASQALASELVLERLLTRLMHVVIENAGAQRGALIFNKNGDFVVQVDASIGDGPVPEAIVGELRSIPLASYPDASGEIIRYVARSRDSVILSDAAREGGFTRSAYVVRRAPKSVLCAPLTSQGRLVAILYLENNLTTGAFTAERLEMLRMLSSQMAISIENALLYREIEQRVAERTTELEKRNVELQQAIEHLRTTQGQLVQAEKMASLGRLTMGIAHELKNPLNFIINFASLDLEFAEELEDYLEKNPSMVLSEVRDIIEAFKSNSTKVREHGQRANNIIHGMLRHAGKSSGESRLVELNALVDDSARLAWHGARTQKSPIDIQLEHDYDASIGQLRVVPQELGRVIVNLVSNAIDAMSERCRAAEGAYRPTLRVRTRRLGKEVVICIEDNGVGIPPDVRERVFEPFFTTKPPGSGVGLGLSLSYEIVVNGHGGSLTFESEPGRGSQFLVTLPLRAGESAARTPST